MMDEKLNRLLNTAGKNFFIFHVEDILASFEDMESNQGFKTSKIKQYYAAQHGFRSKDEYGIRVRVNAVMQIVRENAVKRALEIVDLNDPRILDEAKEKVQKLREEPV